jgi:hypothetical protein
MRFSPFSRRALPMETEFPMVDHQKRNWLRSYNTEPIWFAEKGSDVFIKGQLRNKSPAGICFLSETRFRPQTELVVRMTMPGGGHVASTLSVRAIVKWQNEQTERRRICYQTGAQFVNRLLAGGF